MAQPRILEDPDFYRPQTLLLTLGIVSVVVALFAPIYGVLLDPANGQSVVLHGLRISPALKWATPALHNWLSWGLTALLLLTVASMLASVFQYRRRDIQLKFIRLSSGLVAVSILVAFILTQLLLTAVQRDFANPSGFLSWGAVLLPLALVLNLAANRRVLSDIKKLKSSERFW